MPGHVFYQEFNMPPLQERDPVAENYLFNTMILEISCNFQSISDLIESLTLYGQKDQKITNLDIEWINFLRKNSIDILKYTGNSDSFIKENIRRIYK